ncbi:MAG TPA: hypothetical protein VNQ90_16290 [Chthoniobacteraceae bacterium]|nr:hypothetical protein [Chthoniobacteraceae bacterium]
MQRRTNRHLQLPKPSIPKHREETIAQILREAYRRHCGDRETHHALRQCLRRS